MCLVDVKPYSIKLVSWQGGGLRGELDTLGNGLRRVGASLCGSIENLVTHCTQTFASSGLAATAACKPIQIGRHRIKVQNSQIVYRRVSMLK